MVSKETEQKIAQLQLYEQSLQNFLAQKQQFQMQVIEIDSALAQLESSKDSYKIIANVMVSVDKAELITELKEKKEKIELRIKTLEKQENNIKEKAKNTREDVMEKMKNDKQ
ncbi:MAG: prefoldin subunit [Nanoarchaeota archaeon]|nr:prefoldin subunit [Nanoarchaeota archaeon]MBU1704525.1 prefoldin subunit [Nanoarchaeota archaeon]